MSANWVASWVRGRALCRRRVGVEFAEQVAAMPSLDEALRLLSGTSYGRGLDPAMNLVSAQRAILSTLLWHFRVLAGWGPPLHSSPLEVLAAGFEISNVVEHLMELEGQEIRSPYKLGSFAEAWPSVERSHTGDEVRSALARSVWGDPVRTDPASVLLVMRIRWARRVFDEVPDAAPWARSAMGLLRDRLPPSSLDWAQSALADLDRVCGSRRPSANTSPEEAWREAARWRLQVERSSRKLASASRPGPSSTVGFAGLLACDAWRASAAVAVAAAGGGELTEAEIVLA